MTSVKERIAALQKKQNAATPTTLGSSNTSSISNSTRTATAEKNKMPNSSSRSHNSSRPRRPSSNSVQNRIAAAKPKQQIIMTSQNTNTRNCNVDLDGNGKTENPSRKKVAALADNMKGLNMQAMLGGHQLQQMLSKKRKDHGTASTITATNEKIVENSVSFQRAVIARGLRKGRTIPDSLDGIKLSTE
mmetsp:Transcript_3006/g.4628  ORF Transcript_3006/g.4628 Transcript_3006/m.4628 type:complete len:189 (+) Transcript_3006:247-813(+)